MGFYTGHETLYDYLIQNIPDGEHTFQTVANNTAVDLEIELYNFYGNIVYTENPVLGNEVSSERTLVLKYWGDLTIEQGVTITPQVPKRGMVIHVMGNLHNKGTISMTAKGADSDKAPGQNVFLWKNTDGTFEYIPELGPVGAVGAMRNSGSGVGTPGNDGNAGKGRELGSGGSGAVFKQYSGGITVRSGVAGQSTSYSGGGGSGGTYQANSVSVTGPSASQSRGSSATSSVGNISVRVAGGVGQPSGVSHYGTNALPQGTGGLLIVYCEGDIIADFNSVIESKGINTTSVWTANSAVVGGGASGGGSVNIFHRGKFTNNGTFMVNGGNKTLFGTSGAVGGGGGDGTVNTMQVSFLQNRIAFFNQDHKRITAMDMGYAIQGSVSKIAQFRAESLYRTPIKNLAIGWEIAPDTPSDEAVLEFSKTADPFVPENPIVFEEVLNYRQGVDLYVRARSGQMQTEQTKFAITATIEGA